MANLGNDFQEIAGLGRSPQEIKNDMGEALELVRHHFRDKYLGRLQHTLEHERAQVLSAPPREVALIAALKEFVPPQNHANLDRIGEMFVTLNTWQQMRYNMGLARQSLETRASAQGLGDDASLHADGVYDIDEACQMRNKASGWQFADMLLMLCVLGK